MPLLLLLILTLLFLASTYIYSFFKFLQASSEVKIASVIKSIINQTDIRFINKMFPLTKRKYIILTSVTLG